MHAYNVNGIISKNSMNLVNCVYDSYSVGFCLYVCNGCMKIRVYIDLAIPILTPPHPHPSGEFVKGQQELQGEILRVAELVGLDHPLHWGDGDGARRRQGVRACLITLLHTQKERDCYLKQLKNILDLILLCHGPHYTYII